MNPSEEVDMVQVEAAREWIAEGKWLSANQGATLLRYIDSLRAALRDGPPGEPSEEREQMVAKALDHLRQVNLLGPMNVSTAQNVGQALWLLQSYFDVGRGTATP